MNFHADTTSGEEGVALFQHIRAAHPDLPVILLTAWTHLEAAVELIKAGAADYLAKPWDDRKLITALNNLLELGESRRQLVQNNRCERQRRNALERDFDLRGTVYACLLYTSQVPFVDSSWNSGVRLSNEQPQSTMEATVYMTDEHFISTFGSRLIAGRSFRPDEYLDFETVNSSKEPIGIPAAIVTRKMAEKLYPGIPVAHVIGKVFYSWGDRPIPIVGVLDHLVRPSLQGGPSAREYTCLLYTSRCV